VKPVRFVRRCSAPLIRALPDFGMYCGWILNLTMFFFMIAETPRMPFGLSVSLPEIHAPAWRYGPESETLSVYIDGRRHFYVNGQPVRPDQLQSKLREELSRRMTRIVYFEADANCAYGDAVYAMDAIRGLGAKTLWITPQTRAELDREGFSDQSAHPFAGSSVPK
jgi:biopolymer transport protein ExbD